MARNTPYQDGVAALLLLLLFSLSAIVVQSQKTTHPEEVKALKAVKSSLIDPDKNLKNWKKSDPCKSNWKGVCCCNSSNLQLGDGFLHICKLKLVSMNLSGTLSPALAQLSQLEILSFTGNDIGGSIPAELGSLQNLQKLLLSRNQLTGSLPDELGNLSILKRMHMDFNNISGSLPKSFANLHSLEHLHLNNNSISGQIPHELSKLSSSLLHFALDNNKLSGLLPEEISKMSSLVLLQLDNNNFSGSVIPSAYSRLTNLVKLSLRNCSLQGPIPALQNMTKLSYIDLSLNQLNGPIPSDKLANSMTAVILSNNSLTGVIPAYFSTLPGLQKLSLDNNLLSGTIESSLWQSRNTTACDKLTLDFRTNQLTEIVGNSRVPAHVTLLLKGNSLCSNQRISGSYCRQSLPPDVNAQDTSHINPVSLCNSQESQHCKPPFEYIKTTLAQQCYCAEPISFTFRLESPGFADLCPYRKDFQNFLAKNLRITAQQLNINSLVWQEGPRLEMVLKIFPAYNKAGKNGVFNDSEVQLMQSVFTEYQFTPNDTYGPYSTLLLGFYSPESSGSISTVELIAIILGVVFVSVAVSTTLSFLYINMRLKRYFGATNRNSSSIRNMIPIDVEGVRRFTYKEMALATTNFSESVEIGQGGYGKVYKGVLAGGALVAIKRAQEGSMQGNIEFRTEIKLLSRVHHRHLVSLVGYCDDRDEQMLVYEFIPNGTLKDHISGKALQPLSFATRLRIALGSARGILYLHSEADPPIFHRDVKATNILLDSKFTAKVADFGLSRLAPEANTNGIVPTHVSTVIKGTPGYLDPQYFITRQLTDKSDVYGLGVVFLELLTGLQPISFGKILVREVNIAYECGKIFAVVDERMGDYPQDCAERFAVLALGCCSDDNTARPTMAEVVRELEGIEEMILEADIVSNSTDACSIKLGKRDSGCSSSSSSAVKYPFGSVDLSGSDLVSGTMPCVSPR